MKIAKLFVIGTLISTASLPVKAVDLDLLTGMSGTLIGATILIQQCYKNMVYHTKQTNKNVTITPAAALIKPSVPAEQTKQSLSNTSTQEQEINPFLGFGIFVIPAIEYLYHCVK